MRGGGGGWWSHREVGCSLLVPMVKDEAKGMIQGFKDSGIDSGIFLVPLSSLVLGSKAHRVAKTSTMGLHSGHAAAVLGSSSRQKAASLSGTLRTLHPVSHSRPPQNCTSAPGMGQTDTSERTSCFNPGFPDSQELQPSDLHYLPSPYTHTQTHRTARASLP